MLWLKWQNHSWRKMYDEGLHLGFLVLVHAIGDDHLKQSLEEAGKQQTDDKGYDGGEGLAILIDRRLVGETRQD